MAKKGDLPEGSDRASFESSVSVIGRVRNLGKGLMWGTFALPNLNSVYMGAIEHSADAKTVLGSLAAGGITVGAACFSRALVEDKLASGYEDRIIGFGAESYINSAESGERSPGVAISGRNVMLDGFTRREIDLVEEAMTVRQAAQQET